MASKNIKKVKEPQRPVDDVDDVDQYIPTPPDGGYGWIVVIASFFNHVIVDGIAFTFGVFYDDFLDYFMAGSGKTALVGSLLSGFYLLTAPVAGSLVNKYGCRFVGMMGAFIATIGFVLSIFSTNIYVLMLTYGVIGGIGLGFLYLPSVISVSYYFQDRRALATGIAVCGSGVGCFIFAPLGKYLLETYAWQSAMLIVAGITLQGCFFASLLRPLAPKVAPPKKPRAKNCFDRFCERTGLRKKSKQEEPTDYSKTVDKVQYAKAERERGLRLDSERETVFNSSNKLATEKVPLKVQDESPTTDTTHDLESPSSAECEQLLQDKVSSNNATESESLADKARRDLEKPRESHHSSNGHMRCVSDLCLNSKNGKLPESVDKSELSKPLYRQDIFYSGSMLHVAEFQSHPNISKADYTRSITTIPDDTLDQEYTLLGCISVSKDVYTTVQQMTDFSLLKDPVFFIPCLTNLFGAVGLFIPFVYISKRATELGIPSQNAAFLLSVIGITNTLGRLAAGALADFKWVNSLLMHNVALVCGGVLCILYMFCTNYVSMCLFAAAFGLCIATWISLTSIVLCNLLGLERLTNAFGLLTMTRGIATFIGTPMAGFVYDQTNNLDNCFQVGGLMLLVGGLLCCLLHLPMFNKKGKQSQNDAEEALSKENSKNESKDLVDNEKSVKIV